MLVILLLEVRGVVGGRGSRKLVVWSKPNFLFLLIHTVREGRMDVGRRSGVFDG